MALRPLGETGTAGGAPADNSDATHRALSVLDTAEQVARKTREEAHEQAQRLIAEANEEAERIREEARRDAPELRRATEQLRVDEQRTGPGSASALGLDGRAADRGRWGRASPAGPPLAAAPRGLRCGRGVGEYGAYGAYG